MKPLLTIIFCALLALPSATLWADSAPQQQEVNINTADAAQLAKGLKGVGGAKAKAIVEYRELNGSFKSAEELTEIKGIGVKLVQDNRERIKL
ncbi:helix-hairpin-helix domain-containing protein [Dasania sp. GY-MA-18]|uniref:ComEA family DNA-binding protein n=1 Tax=Dasania phycosphaerae TaxID=2950436 RepID=A0A9J6RIN5_9GAMM|nr:MULTISPECIES: ComEA family DNA-binding protein [Dasania]MCR8921635.1 helix-hairpin-helix domain-containing protein [Dasania sp. GY-MA-18]MCZ0864063.1 ComEA family DNA-binding protein [Dasania phycosphaerae]MCZ0867791.1 ComEA family DNA-binding protein [Dasania phycosphaerae]